MGDVLFVQSQYPANYKLLRILIFDRLRDITQLTKFQRSDFFSHKFYLQPKI
jgi:hypothetical protein